MIRQKLDFFTKGAWKNLQRLKGMTLSRKLNYLMKSAVGEIIRNRRFGIYTLRLVEISMTDRCQCNCKHCFTQTEEPPNELKMPEIVPLLDEMGEIGVPEVCFTGGEPLLHPSIFELISYAAEKNLLVRLITNGVLLNENTVLQLKRAGLGWCSVSLDGPTADVHDAFRGYPGCFDSVIEGLRHLIRNDIPCSINTVARKEILHSGQLEEIIKLGAKLGVSVVRINFPVPMGGFKGDFGQVLTKNERNKVRELMKYGIVTLESPREGTSCTAGITKVNILPNGDLTPCVFVPIPYGNIKHKGLVEIWKNMSDYLELLNKKGECPICDPQLREKILQKIGSSPI